MAVAVTGALWLSGARLFAFPGESMAPTVMPGDYFVGMVGLWGTRAPERFDLVIFDVPPESKWADLGIPWMKRVVGLPGERVRLAGERLFIDGQEVTAPFLHLARTTTIESEVDVALKADEPFVLGDNLDHSFDDSRSLGPIRRSLLQGSVALVIRRGKAEAPKL